MSVLTHQLARSQPAVHNRVSKSDRDGELVDVKKACKERGRRTSPASVGSAVTSHGGENSSHHTVGRTVHITWWEE